MVFEKLFNDRKKEIRSHTKGSEPTANQSSSDRIQTKDDTKDKSKQISRRLGSAGNLEEGSKRKRRTRDKKQDPQTTSRTDKTFHMKKPRREPLSPAAVELSVKLRELSQQKKLDDAISVYWNKKYNSCRDGHHACVVIDCCARCGDVASAESVFHKLDRKFVNTEIYTALLKGYAHSGQSQKAVHLFRKITRKSVPVDHRPNVRTLNTFLRGCLWTAATTDTETGDIVGGVVSSEEIWNLYCQQSESAASTLDVSSYEYSISLLCQALRTEEAQNRINEFQLRNEVVVKGKATILGNDQSVLETLSVVYSAMARAYGLLGNAEGMWISAQRALSAIRSSRSLLTQLREAEQVGHNITTSITSKSKITVAVGGKQGWKTNNEDASNKRMVSNESYRLHRLSELETDCIDFLKSRAKVRTQFRRDVAQKLITNIFYFSGAGTTDRSDLDAKPSPKACHKSESLTCLSTSWKSFGLAELASLENSKISPAFETEFNPETICKIFHVPVCMAIDAEGRMNFEKVFNERTKPLDIEVGAGFGSWIVNCAQENPDRNYVAVELRADRVFQIHARALIQCKSPIKNLCVVGSDCGAFLRHRVRKGTVSTIFANHPEPPTQTYGDSRDELQAIFSGGVEPAHMLHSKTIIDMAECLINEGKIVVVTDNKAYARLLMSTFARVIRNDKVSLASLKSHELRNSSLQYLESFGGNICLFQGLPNNEIGHSIRDDNIGSSYFDRLWRTGAGSHSERKTRFVLVVRRCAE
jgi:pentatricopeptide repeat protein